MDTTTDSIVKAARKAHAQLWAPTNDESTGDKQSIAVTRAWQYAVKSESVCVEVSVSDDLKERIDVVDLSNGYAYEMKASGKNPQHEFYKDVFKVLTYNATHNPKLNRLVFLTEEIGAKRLKRGLGKAVADSMPAYGIEIVIEGL